MPSWCLQTPASGGTSSTTQLVPLPRTLPLAHLPAGRLQPGKLPHHHGGPGRMPSAGCLLWAAALCSCLPGTKPASPSDPRPAGVVPFEEVWSRSYCRARETLVDILSEFPHEAEHIFKPPCVPLWRCAGCCGDESLECVAVETRTIDLQVVRVSPILGTTRQEALQFTEHTRCVCRPRRKRLKNERSHRIGAKRRPREPNPTPSMPPCKPPSLGRSRGQEEVAAQQAKLVTPAPAGRAASPPRSWTANCCQLWPGPCEMLDLED